MELTRRHYFLLLLCFISGAAGLMYQVLWLKQLALLLGSTAKAAAITLTVFFLGLAAGSWYLGERASRCRRPLLGYAMLEFGIAISALLYLLLLHGYGAVYSSLWQLCDGPGVGLAIAKFVLTLAVLLPPCFCMGGTLPFLAQHLIRHRTALGSLGSVVYAVNVCGGVAGALLAGYFLPMHLGIRTSYYLCIACSVAVGVLAFLAGARTAEAPTDFATAPQSHSSEQTVPVGLVRVLAVLSGVFTLALEVLWTRMFAQVLHNSVFTFGAVLTVFLLSLAVGAWGSSMLIRYSRSARGVLITILSLSGILTVVGPMIFYHMTDGMRYLGQNANWIAYLRIVFGTAALVIGPAVVAAGCVFPFTLKLFEAEATGSGRSFGNLAALNTLGAFAGSLAAGFLLLPMFGLWNSVRLIAVMYLVTALIVALGTSVRSPRLLSLPILGIVLCISVLDPARLPLVRVDPVKKGEALIETWESADGTVAVVKRNGNYRLKVNNYYTLGSTRSQREQEWQTNLPMLLHPSAKRVFFLGMGTGITAGASLAHPVSEVVVTELLPDVVRASERYYQDHVAGLFDDNRVTIHADDGRNVLRGTDEQFDLIVADLFTPWKAGTGNLYSHDHYLAARKRLTAGGVYAQWIPLYQVSEGELRIILKTMTKAFPQVSLWRGDFYTKRPTILLLGHLESRPLDFDAIITHTQSVMGNTAGKNMGAFVAGASEGRHPPTKPQDLLMFYLGTASMLDLAQSPVNSDDFPVIEYWSPQTQRAEKAGEAEWLVRDRYAKFLGALKPDSTDDFLVNVPDAHRRRVAAGHHLHLAILEAVREAGNTEAVQQHFQAYRDSLTDDTSERLLRLQYKLERLLEANSERDALIEELKGQVKTMHETKGDREAPPP